MANVNIFDLVKAKEFDVLLAETGNSPELLRQLNESGYTIVHTCAEVAPVWVMSKLYSQGANFDIRDNENLSPFCWAVDGENFEVADYILSTGVERDVCSNEGRFPIHEATFYGDKPAVKYLLSIGVAVDQKDRRGWTILHYAAMNADLDLIRFLSDRGANFDEKDEIGITPLHVAATSNIMTHQMPNYLQAIELLIERGADIFARTNAGETAEEMSYYNDISQLLTRYRENAS